MVQHRTARVVTAEQVLKGDYPGHPFRGNQWTGGGSFDGPVLQRGFNMKLSEEDQEQVRRWQQPPTSLEEVGQDRKIGPMLVDRLKQHEEGLGKHWTSDPNMADTAARQGNTGGMPVRVTAKTRSQDVEMDPSRLKGNDFTSESETTFKPGAKFQVTDVELMTPGGSWYSVWPGIEKGDYPGHPFRGNQWTGGGGGTWSAGDTPSFFMSHEEKQKAIADFDALPPDSKVRLYHGTSVQNADSLRESGKAGSGTRGDDVSGVSHTTGVYVAPTAKDAEAYAGRDGVVIEVVVRRGDVVASPEAGDKSPGRALFDSFDGALVREGKPLEVSKGDYPGHPFRGNQWTGGGGGAGGSTGGAMVTTSLGEIRRVSDDEYEITRGKTTAGEVKKLGNPRGSYSTAINPMTGHRMSNTELGDTMEVLIINELSKSPSFTAVMGGGMRHIVGAGDAVRDRRGPIDITTRKHAIEVKSVSMAAKDPKVSIKPDELESKAMASRELGKPGAVLIPMIDPNTNVVEVYAYLGNPDWLPTYGAKGEGRLQIKRNKNGWQETSIGNTVKVGEIKLTKKKWETAQKTAGWNRDSAGKLRPISKAMESQSSFVSKNRDDENDIEDGDMVIGIAEDGTPFVGWAGEPSPRLLAFAREFYGAEDQWGDDLVGDGGDVTKASEPLLTGELVSKDDEQQLVFGWANVATDEEGRVVVDRQGDWLTTEELEKAAYNYVLESRDGGVQHAVTGVSTVVESMVFTEEKMDLLGIEKGTLPEGWWVGFKIHDDIVWKGVKEGDFTDFSIHGMGTRASKAAGDNVVTPTVSKLDRPSLYSHKTIVLKARMALMKNQVTPLEQKQRESAAQVSASRRKKMGRKGFTPKQKKATESSLRAAGKLGSKDKTALLNFVQALKKGKSFKGATDEEHSRVLTALKKNAKSIQIEEDGSGSATLKDGRKVSFAASPGSGAFDKNGKLTKSR